jgi:hypothetical protein
MNKKSEIFAIIEQIKANEKEKVIAKYCDLDINIRYSKECLLVDILEDLQKSLNLFEAYSIGAFVMQKRSIRHVMFDVASELIETRNNNGNR